MVKKKKHQQKFIHIFHRFYRFRFLLHKYLFLIFYYAKRMLLSEQPTVLFARIDKHNDFDQFWKFRLHFEHFPRNTVYLSFDGSSNYLYLFKHHRQASSWPGELPSSHLKVTRTWFGPNIKYLLETFFADFCCREGISCCYLNCSFYNALFIS